MKLAFSICAAALLWTAAAKPLAVGPLGSGDAWSHEASTNVAVSCGLDELRVFSLMLACEATSSNNVEVALGCDANGDGVLQLDEAEFSIGWDCGAWFVREEPMGRVVREARDAGRRVLAWRMVVGEDGEPKALSATDGSDALFAAAARRPPRSWFNRAWNLARVAVRGLPDAEEAIAVEVSRIGLSVRVR